MIHFSILSRSRLWKTALSSLPRRGANQLLIAPTPLVCHLNNSIYSSGNAGGNGSGSYCLPFQQVRHRAHWSKRRYKCSYDQFLREGDWRSSSRPDMVIPLAHEISKADFLKVLAEYPGIIERLPTMQCPTPVPLTLRQLDDYRFGQAITDFSNPETAIPMTALELKKLIEWRIRRGLFAPTTRGLCHTNHGKEARRILAEGIKVYRDLAETDLETAIVDAMVVFCRMRGIGCLYASVILAVVDPARIPVFSNELFHWVCCKGRRRLVKDSIHEFKSLRTATAKLVDRLNKDGEGPPVTMMDAEKVAFVLYKPDDQTMKFDWESLSKKARRVVNSDMVLPSQVKAEEAGEAAELGAEDDEQARQAQLDAKLADKQEQRLDAKKQKELNEKIDKLPERIRNKMYSADRKHYRRAKINLEMKPVREAEQAARNGDFEAESDAYDREETRARLKLEAEADAELEATEDEQPSSSAPFQGRDGPQQRFGRGREGDDARQERGPSRHDVKQPMMSRDSGRGRGRDGSRSGGGWSGRDQKRGDAPSPSMNAVEQAMRAKLVSSEAGRNQKPQVKKKRSRWGRRG